MRLEITRKSDLAVRALRALGQAANQMKAPEIASVIGSTASFVPHVLTPLVKAGWITSGPGRTGGYSLVVSLDDVSVLAVIEAIEGPTESGRCVLVDGPCDVVGSCAIHSAWRQARVKLLDELDHVAISDAAVGCHDPSNQ